MRTPDARRRHEQDDAVRDCPDVKRVSDILREIMGNGTADLLWSSSYADIVLAWRRACDQLKASSYVTYQLRHESSLYDRAQQLRSQESMQNRGGRKRLKSVKSYGKAGRVAQEAQ